MRIIAGYRILGLPAYQSSKPGTAKIPVRIKPEIMVVKICVVKISEGNGMARKIPITLTPVTKAQAPAMIMRIAPRICIPKSLFTFGRGSKGERGLLQYHAQRYIVKPLASGTLQPNHAKQVPADLAQKVIAKLASDINQHYSPSRDSRRKLLCMELSQHRYLRRL